MRELLQHLALDLAHGRLVVLCRVVETRGSTPQKAGAAMLVYPSGEQRGTLGGGCVEAEVKRRALVLLAENRSEICTFQLDNDYGWDDGLICGGRMRVLVEPVTSPPITAYLQAISLQSSAGLGFTEIIVWDFEKHPLTAEPGRVATSAESIANVEPPAAATFAIDDAGTLIAKTTSFAAPASLIQQRRPLDARPRPYAADGLAYLPHLPRCKLVIVGGGHVGRAVANLAADLDFEIIVIDDREEIISPERFPMATHRIAGSVHDVLPKLAIDSSTYCLIVTRGHHHDEESLFYLAERGARYVGLIGSRRKIKMIFRDLLSQGISRAALAAVHAPLGIDIGSQTVPEIAVSIAAELVAHRNRGEVPGRPASLLDEITREDASSAPAPRETAS